MPTSRPARPTEADEVRWHEQAKPLTVDLLRRDAEDSNQSDGYRKACLREPEQLESMRASLAKGGL